MELAGRKGGNVSSSGRSVAMIGSSVVANFLEGKIVTKTAS